MITPTDVAEIGGLGLTFSTLIVGGLVRLTSVITKQNLSINECTREIKELKDSHKEIPERLVSIETVIKARFCPWTRNENCIPEAPKSSKEFPLEPGTKSKRRRSQTNEF